MNNGARKVLEKVEASIRKTGWAVIATPLLGDPTIPMAYTVGLVDAGLPELIITGLDPENSKGILNAAARKMKERKAALQEHQRDDEIAEGYGVVAVRVDREKAASVMLWAAERARAMGQDFEAMQIVWPDTQNRLPWERGFERKFLKVQRLLPAQVPRH